MIFASTVLSSSARTTTGTSASIPIQYHNANGNLALLVNVTAAGGTTPTLDLSVEWSADGTIWIVGQPSDSFTQFSATGTAARTFLVKGMYYRVRYTIGGTTPSFTFSVQETQY